MDKQKNKFKMVKQELITIEKLYSVFGRYDNVATFFFKEGSTAFETYGSYITGSIRYRPKDRILLQKGFENGNQSGLPQIVKLGYVFPGDDRAKCLKLRRDGFTCDNIKEYHFVPWHSEDKFNKIELRELPNVIKIKVDTNNFSKGIEDNFTLNRHIGSLNAGWEFIEEEKFEFIGIYTALNEGTFPEEYLEKLQIDVDEIQKNDRFWLYYYATKEKHRALSDDEKNIYFF